MLTIEYLAAIKNKKAFFILIFKKSELKNQWYNHVQGVLILV